MFLFEMSIFHLIECSFEVMALTQEQVSRYIFILASYCMLRTKKIDFTDQPCNNRVNKVLAPLAFSVLAWTPWNILVFQIDCSVISDHVSEMSLRNVSYDFKAITISSAQFDYWTTINAWWTWDQNTFTKRTGAHQQKQKKKRLYMYLMRSTPYFVLFLAARRSPSSLSIDKSLFSI